MFEEIRRLSPKNVLSKSPKKRVRFNKKCKIKEIPSNKDSIVDKKYNELYNVKYSKTLMKQYSTIQNEIGKILDKFIAHNIHRPDDKDADSIKIYRDDVVWTEDNSPILFMKHILNKRNLNNFCNKLDTHISNSMKVGETSEIDYYYKPYHICFNKIERVC